MGMMKPLTLFVERRLASPFWLRTTRLAELLSRSRVRLKGPAQDEDDLRGRFCSRPFSLFEMHENGSVFLCCPTWLPGPVGNLNTQDAREIWNSKLSSLIDGMTESFPISPFSIALTIEFANCWYFGVAE